MACGGRTRAERAREQATKKERDAREQVVKQETTIASLRAPLIALEERSENAEDTAREAHASKVKPEALPAENGAECDQALIILNRTYGKGPSPARHGDTAVRDTGREVESDLPRVRAQGS